MLLHPSTVLIFRVRQVRRRKQWSPPGLEQSQGYGLNKTGHELKPLHCYFKLEHCKVSMEGTYTNLEPPFLPFLLVLSKVLRSTAFHPKSIIDLSLRLSSCHMEEQAPLFLSWQEAHPSLKSRGRELGLSPNRLQQILRAATLPTFIFKKQKAFALSCT